MTDDRLAPFVAHPESAGLFLDFDGTLSDIVLIPADARPLPNVPQLLNDLASRFRVVSIVSGRAAAQLVDWLGPDIEIWGVHGAERAVEGVVQLSDWAAPHEDNVQEAAAAATQELTRRKLAGALVENKRVIVNIHFRAADDPIRAQKEIAEIADELASRFDLVTKRGRMSYELRPAVDFSKRAVIEMRASEEELRAAAFFGDDRVDLPGFDALDELEAAGIATLRVAVSSPEAPAELLERADVVVAGPAGAVDLLERLRRG
ncbi:MAG: trehalose 6-phosphate phosphatase [Actinomycetota bacterium]|nr:trehalose 6-phosphate phosphatase [Actinomycetota bacterium]MEA2487376.1 trehalose 6-phosphate phosphatase [Actinomycetota bacterium]